jgi:hypothetical protein
MMLGVSTIAPFAGWRLDAGRFPRRPHPQEAAPHGGGSRVSADTGRRDGRRPAKRRGLVPAEGVIVTFSLPLSSGSGIVTSSTPSFVVAWMRSGSTASGSASEREKLP